MARVAVIGIVGNSVFMTVDHFHQSGETLSADSLYEEIGGKGFNQAVACAKMGAQVSFLGAVGEDTVADQCRRTAQEYGIDGFFAVKKGTASTIAFILTDTNGENRVTVYRSAQLTNEDVLDFEPEIAKSDLLLLQNEVPTAVNMTAVELAKKHGVRVILNPAPARDIPDELAQNVFVVTPNEQESRAIDVSRFKNCVTTLGKNGCCINDEIFIKSLAVDAVDTTGAGDTFNGVLAVCIAEGMDIQTACEYAVKASGLSVTRQHVLDAIPERREIEN